MFNNNKSATEQEHSKSSNIIGKGTQLEGSLSTAGNLRIEGKVKGSIHTKTKVVLSETSVVEGDIIAQNAEIGGEVHGTVRVASLLNLKPTALVHGDIITSKLMLEAGARFNGKCNMGGNVKTEEPTSTKEKNSVTPKASTQKEPTPKGEKGSA